MCGRGETCSRMTGLFNSVYRADLFPENFFLMVFTIYGHGGHLGHVI